MPLFSALFIFYCWFVGYLSRRRGSTRYFWSLRFNSNLAMFQFRPDHWPSFQPFSFFAVGSFRILPQNRLAMPPFPQRGSLNSYVPFCAPRPVLAFTQPSRLCCSTPNCRGPAIKPKLELLVCKRKISKAVTLHVIKRPKVRASR